VVEQSCPATACKRSLTGTGAGPAINAERTRRRHPSSGHAVGAAALVVRGVAEPPAHQASSSAPEWA
jgi:hypothetical protein